MYNNVIGIDPGFKGGIAILNGSDLLFAEKVPVMSKELLHELLEKMEWKITDVDYFLPPQLSKIMTDKIISHLEIPTEKTLNCVEFTGNNGNALPFLQLEKLFGTMTKNQKAMIIAIESSKWLKAGVTLYV